MARNRRPVRNTDLRDLNKQLLSRFQAALCKRAREAQRLRKCLVAVGK
jgi:hypothetical protein